MIPPQRLRRSGGERGHDGAGAPQRVRRWRLVSTIGALAALTATISVSGRPALGAALDATTARARQVAASVDALSRAAGGRATFAYRGDGDVAHVAATAGHRLTGPNDADPGDAAREFLDEHAPMFGGGFAPGAAKGGDASELVEVRRNETLDGTAVRFQQTVDGVPVFAGELVVAVEPDGVVVAAGGEVTDDVGVSTGATVSADAAAAVATSATARATGTEPAELTPSTPELWIYDPALLGAGGIPGSRLVWRTSVASAAGDVDQLVLVDAVHASVALSFSQIEQAKDRRVCDASNAPGEDPACTSPVLREGGDPSARNADVRAAYVNAGHTYDFYRDVLGRDSIDDAGMPIISTVRWCPGTDDCPWRNAMWDGRQMVYGAGFAAGLDVVAHELTHGVTEQTSQLLYFGQSGAINESMSDVFGEIIELEMLPGQADPQWLLGEDLAGGAIRSMSDPTDFGDPDRMTSPLYWSSDVDGYGVHENSGVGNKAAQLLADGGTFNGTEVTGIGRRPTARIYYQAQTAYLGPGSDYADLAQVLPQACASLVGSGGIVAADCDQVARAVDAVDMEAAPSPAALALKLPLCPAGQEVSRSLLSSDFESGSGGWVTGATTPAGKWTTQQLTSDTSGLHGPSTTSAGTSQSAMRDPVSIPSAGITYLSFDHAFEFEYSAGLSGSPNSFWDGGVVRFQRTRSGSAFTNVSALGAPMINGYEHEIYTGFGNPFAGQKAFTAASPGWQTTRIDVSALAGEDVKFQFAIGSDVDTAYSGWFIDSVDIYQCGPAVPASTVPTPATTVPVATGTVTSPGSTGQLVALSPCRLVDTRGGAGVLTVPLAAGETYEVDVRGGACPVPAEAAAILANVTVTGAERAGFVTAYPCDAPRPNASSLNYDAGDTVGNSVVAKLSATGMLCFYAHSATHLVVDIGGYTTGAGTYVPLVPARLADTRAGGATVDGRDAGDGTRAAGSTLELQVAGRGGVPAGGATAAALNVTVTGSTGGGYVTAYPCDQPRPNASSLNHAAGRTVGNAVIAKLSAQGTVCLFTWAATDVVVDLAGWFPVGGPYVPLVPGRVVDTRPGWATVDGIDAGIGARVHDSVTQVQLSGRAGIPTGATAVTFNLTAVDPTNDGYVTVFPCGEPRPTASNLNFAAGRTGGNSVVAKLPPTGAVCLYTYGSADLVLDVTGYLAAT